MPSKKGSARREGRERTTMGKFSSEKEKRKRSWDPRARVEYLVGGGLRWGKTKIKVAKKLKREIKEPSARKGTVGPPCTKTGFFTSEKGAATSPGGVQKEKSRPSERVRERCIMDAAGTRQKTQIFQF